ncbi:hypothetical protein, partial [Clavibacter michiganensis]|uniref:hypothetical protein n=1 Tax=Clavibacter michiganensis TaxID=28447 RepID=UPI00292F09FF
VHGSELPSPGEPMTQREEELARVLSGPEFATIRPDDLSVLDYSLLTLRRARLLNGAGFAANSLWLGRGDSARFPEFLRTMGWIGAYDLSLLNVLVSHQIAGDALLSHGGPEQLDAWAGRSTRWSGCTASPVPNSSPALT